MTNEKLFKKTMLKIGIAMIIFVVAFNVLFSVLSIIMSILELFMQEIPYNILSELLYAIVYLASFFIPAIILRAITKKDAHPIMLKRYIPSGIDIAAYVLATISMVLTMAILNAKFVEIFNYAEFSSEFLWGNDKLAPYQLVLSFITTAIVPAICEEFLFRGAILSALKPYGKAPAIVISGVLFGLMHQNIEQLLYTTIAGLVLAWVVYETGSIWVSVLIHFFNNFVSVFETAVIDRLYEKPAMIIIYTFEALIFIFGIASVVYLLVKHSKKKRESGNIISDGIYGKAMNEITRDDMIPERPLPAGKVARCFFSPTIIVFMVLSGATMLLNIVFSILYSYIQ